MLLWWNWQTRQLEGLVGEISYGFKSHQQYQYGALDKLVKSPAFHAGTYGFDPHTHHHYGVLVQKSRTPACHAGGHGFKSRIHRHIQELGVTGSITVSKTVGEGSSSSAPAIQRHTQQLNNYKYFEKVSIASVCLSMCLAICGYSLGGRAGDS